MTKPSAQLALMTLFLFAFSLAGASPEPKDDKKDEIKPSVKRERLINLDLKTREAKAYKIKAEIGIYVVRYEPQSKTYLVRIENEPAVGPNITSLEWLIEGIDNGSTVRDFKRHPKRLVGGYFKLKKPLWLLTEDELEDRLEKGKP